MKASVIIPAYNAEKTIGKCLESLKKQSFSKSDFEIIVVDDGSTDKTSQLVFGFKNVLLLQQANAGPAVARNRGAQKAKGDIIVFLDSDCVVKPSWLEEMLKPFENPVIVGVQGKYENLLSHWMACFIQFEIEERYARMQKKRFIDFVGSYSAAYRKKIFLENHGFDAGFRRASGEDPDLSFRLAEKGHKMVFAPKAVVHHFHPTSLLKYWKTKFYRAYWRVRMYAKNPQKMKGDSYTNPLLKYQMGFLGAGILFGILSTILTLVFPSFASFFEWGFIATLCAIIFVFLLSFPFVSFIFQRSRKLGILAFFIQPITILIFIFGYSYGEYKLIWRKKR